MENNNLTGIERELVLQYLMDGNIPVTLTPYAEQNVSTDEVKPLTSAVFPIALKGENIKVSKNGKIILENPSQSVKAFESKNVKVEFYFNRVGLFFNSIVKKDSDGLYLSIPDEISHIEEIESAQNYEFKAALYFNFNLKKDVQFECIPWKHENLFSRPVWKSIPLENQQNAKKYLEQFVKDAKVEKNAGNGIQLIPICNYLTMNSSDDIKSVQNRVSPLNILYVDHERIVLGYEKKDGDFKEAQEFGLKFSFSLKNGPIQAREIFLTGIVNKIYSSNDGVKNCADIRYTTIQEEDLRFIYEKATKTLFI